MQICKEKNIKNTKSTKKLTYGEYCTLLYLLQVHIRLSLWIHSPNKILYIKDMSQVLCLNVFQVSPKTSTQCEGFGT